ncbi:MAG: GtrA family protein [Deltaproteobacteria bacterium]|nr:GtrA family protein [Deltaproteobacteria bacterium]
MKLAETIDEKLIRIFPLFGAHPFLFDLFRFCVVGGLGVLVDSAVLFTVVEAFGLLPAIGVFPAFAVAVSFNYAFNRAWTYRSRPRKGMLGGYAAFVAICAVGAGLRAGIMFALLCVPFFAAGRGYLIANLVGIVIVTLFNFVLTRFLAFPGAAGRGGQGSSTRAIT